jgi:hypothetical protein
MRTANPHVLCLLAVILIIGLLPGPVTAGSSIITTGWFNNVITEVDAETTDAYYFSNAGTDRAISLVSFEMPKGTELTFTISHGNQSTSGYAKYTGTIGWGTTEIGIGSGSDSREFVDLGTDDWSLLQKIDVVGYANQQDDNGTVIDQGYCIYDASANVGGAVALHLGYIAYQPVSPIQPIDSISFTATKPVKVTIKTGNRAEIAKVTSDTGGNVGLQWINFAISIAGMLLSLVLGMFAWLKFLFVDNLILIIALYISVSMAYSAMTSSNIFQFYKKFFRFQRSMFQFMVELWNYLIQIISAFRGIFRI